jgi:hypothetical protein
MEASQKPTASCFGARSAQPPANLVPHAFAEGFPARGSFLFVDIVPVEDVEILKDRVTIAGHRQDTKQFTRRPARASYFPSADGVGAVTGREATEFCHVGCGETSADGLAKIVTKLP